MGLVRAHGATPPVSSKRSVAHVTFCVTSDDERAEEVTCNSVQTSFRGFGNWEDLL